MSETTYKFDIEPLEDRISPSLCDLGGLLGCVPGNGSGSGGLPVGEGVIPGTGDGTGGLPLVGDANFSNLNIRLPLAAELPCDAGSLNYIFEAGVTPDAIYADWGLSADLLGAEVDSRTGHPCIVLS